MSERPKIQPGPHFVHCVIGIDGSFISEAYWWREHADEYAKRCGPPCRAETFRLVRVIPKKKARKGSP
jgi:hypothetical protein